MEPKTLRVRASGSTLVQNHERLAQGVNAFLCRRFEAKPDQPDAFHFVPTNEPEEVPYRAEYRHALVASDLLPADEATATFTNEERAKDGLKPIEFDVLKKKPAKGGE